MSNTLLETYAKRLAVSESYYSRANRGAKMDATRKFTTAALLDNVNDYMSKKLKESFSNSVGTQRADLGAFKKFCMNLTTVVMPNLIAHDLVLVQPLPSIVGYVSYLKFTYGSNKGGIKQGDVIADPFHIESRTEDNSNYTSQAVVEEVELDGEGKATLAWHPIFKAEGKGLAEKDERIPTVVGVEGATVEVIDAEAGIIKVTGATGKCKIRYMYNNVIIPQNDLPIINAEMEGITVHAKPRRIAIYYSAIAAFQAEKDYGFNLQDQLQEKAIAELNYEIDEEVVRFLVKLAETNSDAEATLKTLTFDATIPVGVSMRDHYEGFNATIEKAKVAIFQRTQRLHPTYLLVSPAVLPILSMITSFKATSTAGVAGPFLAGTLNGLKVFVSPAVTEGKFIVGVNNGTLAASAALYAPYLPVMPSQLLGYSDGSMSQGFVRMDAIEALNPQLVVEGQVTNNDYVVNVKTVA